jgi:peptide/nickel transport system permease protein
VFGTTQGQYDIFYGIVWGTRTAFRVGLIATISVTIIGTLLGLIAGYYGGVVDDVIMRVVDVSLSLPRLIGAMIMATILGRGIYGAIIALILFGWMPYVRVVRGEVLSVKALQFVEAAHAIGTSDARIMRRHILPNVVYPVLVLSSMEMGSMVLWVSTLSFLGLGPEIGYADWGQLVSFGRDWLIGVPGDALRYWYTVFFPAISITLFVVSWGLIGDALRDALDPKL